MTYAEQLTAALEELDRLSQLEARMQVLRDISIRQQLDVIAMAITSNNQDHN